MFIVIGLPVRAAFVTGVKPGIGLFVPTLKLYKVGEAVVAV